ncbi:hypothetical protein RFI02_13600 [Acinetobacter sichuanensis]|uniref:hypothetical protein n=1 Tax=Acinetobacter sichuanensis TaxID=2136183 RepID=UPI00280EBC37|nr:hypothetical protein [Acinetobacter sichuanensis]MDQ9022139.1 hypothetical protein [Acinetobacter sichuanensis]
MKKVELSEAQLDYIKQCIEDEIETAKASISCADKKIDQRRAKTELEFFEEFKKAIN